MGIMAKKFLQKEDGNILLIFAGAMVLIAFFIGICLDVSMIYVKRNSMQNILQIIREERFTYQDTIRYSDNPALTTYHIAYSAAAENGFDGIVTVYFREEDPEPNYRSYQVRILLTDECPFYFGRIFGLNTVPLNVSLDGGESYGEGSADVIWHSPLPVSNYNGAYTGIIGDMQVVYDSTELPPDW